MAVFYFKIMAINEINMEMEETITAVLAPTADEFTFVLLGATYITSFCDR